MSVNVPSITNTKPIKVGEEIVVLAKSEPRNESQQRDSGPRGSEPDAKRAKTIASDSNAVKAGKGKDKGNVNTNK